MEDTHPHPGHPQEDGLSRLARFAQRPMMELALRWLLGGIFVVAAIPKVLDPMALARMIDGYALLPDAWIDPLAYLLAWSELAAALSLILGLYPKWGLVAINAMLSIFIVAITFNVLRGHEFNCGCFSLDEETSSGSPLSLLARDAIMLIIGLHLLQVSKRLYCLWDPHSSSP